MSQVKDLRIEKSQLDRDISAPFIRGGFGDVFKGTLKGTRVAIKELRPGGDKNQRLRVAAVRLNHHISVSDLS